MSPAKTAEPIEMPFGILSWVDSRKRVRWGADYEQFYRSVWPVEKHFGGLCKR